MSYRPIVDSWLLTRCKHGYYGGFPGGFLARARALLGVGPQDSVLHVCGGMVRKYPYGGFGPRDATLDLNVDCQPDYLRDAREPYPDPWDVGARTSWSTLRPSRMDLWPAVLIDRPYTEADADKYPPGRDVLPTCHQLVKQGIDAVPVGGKVGILDYEWPACPSNAREIAVIAVYTGRRNRARQYTVFERLR